ncbi:hypothetical protein EC988_003377 [Linderina pennispora]|nr:hypothetical protein EC988_003377 [Linderina pennispora]
MMLSETPSPATELTTVFKYGDMPSVALSTRAVTVTAHSEDSMDATTRIEDVPSIDQVPLNSDALTVKRTIIYDEMVAYEMQQQPSKSDGRQIYQVCGRTIENKQKFPFEQFTNCLRIAATYMAQNIAYHGGQELEKYSDIGFWSPRVKLLYAQGMEAYEAICNDETNVDPSMLNDEVFVCAQVSVRPFAFSMRFCSFPFSAMATCQVQVCKGTRPESFLRDVQLANDINGLGRLIAPPISDVVLLHPETQRLSEGLLSNFFVTRYVPPPAKTRDGMLHAADRTRFVNYHLICAPLATIHQGKILDVIWKICQRDSIQVSFGAPILAEGLAGKWSGAFIVNTTYALLPIDTMYLTDRRHTKVEFGTCPLVTHLQTAVFKMLNDVDPAFL